MSKLWKPTRRLFLAGAIAGLAAPAILRGGSMPLLGAGARVVGGDAAATTTFLARADASTTIITERQFYKDLINGLNSDGILAKQDVLQIYSTDTQAHCLLNLAQNAYDGTVMVGGATFNFTPGRGVASPDGAYVDTNFNPFTQSGTCHYQQDSAHYAYWSNTAGVENHVCIGNDNVSTHLHPDFSGGDCYMRINDASASGLCFTGAAGDGLYIASRTSSSNRDAYYKGVSQGNANSATSAAVANANFTVNFVGGVPASTKQCSAISIGGKLTSAEAGQLYSRLRTFMTAVGVP